MQIATLIGILAGMGLLVGAVYFGAGSYTIFINLPGIAIVLGGTAASTFISYPLSEALRIFKLFFTILIKRGEPPTEQVTAEIIQLANVGRQGFAALEKELDTISDLFLRDGVQLIIDGYGENDIDSILETRIREEFKREMGEAQIFRTMAKFSPAFGMVGTLIGLIGMLSNMGDNFGDLGPNMAVALVTTFYGVILANLFYTPIAIKMEEISKEEAIVMRLVKKGVLLLYSRQHPLTVQEKLNAFLPPRKWQEFDPGGGY